MNTDLKIKDYVAEIGIIMSKQLDLIYNYFSSDDIVGCADDFPFFSLFVNLKKNLYEAAVRDLYKQGFDMADLLNELNDLPEFKGIDISIIEKDGDLVFPNMVAFLGKIPNTKPAKNKFVSYRLDLLSFNRYTMGLEYILFKAEVRMVDRLYDAFRAEADNWFIEDFEFRQKLNKEWSVENKKIIEGYKEWEDEFGYCPNLDFMYVDSFKDLKFTETDFKDEFGNELPFDEVPTGVFYKRFREQADYYYYCKYRKYPCYSKALTLDDHNLLGVVAVDKSQEFDLLVPEENNRIHSLWEVNTDKTYGCRLIKDKGTEKEQVVDLIACVPYLGEEIVRNFHDVKSGGYIEHQFQEMLSFRVEKEKVPELRKILGTNKIFSVFDVDDKYAYLQVPSVYEWEYKDLLHGTNEQDSIMIENNVGVPALHFSKDYKTYLLSAKEDLLKQGFEDITKKGGNYTADGIEFFDLNRINDKKKTFEKNSVTWYVDAEDDDWDEIIKDSNKEVKDYQQSEEEYWKLMEELYGDLDYQPGMEPSDKPVEVLKTEYVAPGSFKNQLITETYLLTDKTKDVKTSKYKKVDKYHYLEHIENPSYYLDKNHFLDKVVYRLGDIDANEKIDEAIEKGEPFELLGKEELLKNYNAFLSITLSILGREVETSTFSDSSIIKEVVESTYKGMYKSLVSQALTVQTMHARGSKGTINKTEIQKFFHIHYREWGKLISQYEPDLFTDEQMNELRRLLEFEFPTKLQ